MEDIVELANLVKEWWKQHEYDTTGDYGEYNVYNYEPKFVTKAKEIIGDWDK